MPTVNDVTQYLDVKQTSNHGRWWRVLDLEDLADKPKGNLVNFVMTNSNRVGRGRATQCTPINGRSPQTAKPIVWLRVKHRPIFGDEEHSIRCRMASSLLQKIMLVSVPVGPQNFQSELRVFGEVPLALLSNPRMLQVGKAN